MRKLKPSGIEWIGDVPEGWKVERAKNMFKQRTSKGNETLVLLAATQRSGMIPQSLIEGVVQVAVGTDLQSFRTVRKNDFVISLRSFQGGFELSEYEGVCSPAYQVFHANRPIQTRFYKYMFKSDGFISKMNSLTVGIREGKNIQYKDFATALIPQPSLSEQHDIASYLDTKCAQLDELVANEQTQIEKLKQYRKSVITETVTKGLDPTARTKPSGVEWIGETPGHWRISKAKHCWLRVSSGVSVNAGNCCRETDVEYGVLKTSSVSSFIFKPQEHKQVNRDEYSRVSCPVQKDTIIVSRMNTPALVGACAYVDEDYPNLFLPDRLWKVEIRETHFAKYLWYFLTSTGVRDHIASLSSGTSSSMQNISQEQFGNVFVLLPPLSEQRTIAEYLDNKCSEIDALIGVKEAKIVKLGEYKKALIYECVTGKREVEAISNAI